MLKKERLRYICEKVNNKGVITVNEIIQDLDVSDMTVRRDLDELEKAKKQIGRGYAVQRYKGLGEMNADQLWETTMNPETRTLIQVSIEDAALVERRVSVLMGDKVEPRREWIEDNVQFSLEDSFFINQ